MTTDDRLDKLADLVEELAGRIAKRKEAIARLLETGDATEPKLSAD